MTYYEKLNLVCNYQTIVDEVSRQLENTQDDIKIKMLFHLRKDFIKRIDNLRKELGYAF